MTANPELARLDALLTELEKTRDSFSPDLAELRLEVNHIRSNAVHKLSTSGELELSKQQQARVARLLVRAGEIETIRVVEHRQR